jgi:DNA topoisomerase IA
MSCVCRGSDSLWRKNNRNGGSTCQKRKPVSSLWNPPRRRRPFGKYLGTGLRRSPPAMGHLRDLPEEPRWAWTWSTAIEPEYDPHQGQGRDHQASCREAAEQEASDDVYLATDPDREGEAISWHLAQSARAEHPGRQDARVTFNEITKRRRQTVGMASSRARSTWTWSTRSRRAAFSTASWAIS